MLDETGRACSVLRRLRVLDTPPEVPFDRVARLAARLLDAPIALVSLVDEHRQWSRRLCQPRCVRNRTATCRSARTRSGRPASCWSWRTGTADERFRDNPLVTGPPHVRFYAGAPIRDGAGHALGTVCVIDTAPRPALSAAQRAVLMDLADLAAEQLELADLRRPPRCRHGPAEPLTAAQ